MKKKEQSTFHLFFAVPEQVVLDDEIISVSVPGMEGAFEVLKDHASIFALLTKGKVEVVDRDNKIQSWEISGGYFEMSHNQATMLVDEISTC